MTGRNIVFLSLSWDGFGVQGETKKPIKSATTAELEEEEKKTQILQEKKKGRSL